MITTPVNIKKTRKEIYDLHLTHIDGMLERIIDANLKLVAHKCQWAYDASQPMEWLGFTLENKQECPHYPVTDRAQGSPLTAFTLVCTYIVYTVQCTYCTKESDPIREPDPEIEGADHLK